MTLVLPAGTNTNVRSLAVADFNADGKLDLAAANFDNDTITVFLNTRTAVGALSFDGGTSFLCDANPTGLVATDLDGDNKVDLIVSCDTATTDLNADGVNDFRIEVFAGNGAGGFTAAPIRVRRGMLRCSCASRKRWSLGCSIRPPRCRNSWWAGRMAYSSSETPACRARST